jgi:hypothetical protein
MHANGGFMKNFEDELDDIRIMLFEETKGLDIEDIINSVNSNAKKIAREFGIKIETKEEYLESVNV